MKVTPLSERLRPDNLNEYIGQEHLLGNGAVLQKIIQSGRLSSMIFWGPPGVGKTTLAKLVAHETNYLFMSISAINSGVKDIREIIEKAVGSAFPTMLFIDEIHRFNKSQQDSLLQAVETGTVVLVGATTENPSFEVNSALLSRCQVFVLKAFDEADLKKILDRAVVTDEYLRTKQIEIKEYEALFNICGGDARKLLNLLEIAVLNTESNNVIITNEYIQAIAQKKVAIYDKGGEQHYDIISAFIKSIRGGDPNAGVYWLARMIEGGEDVKFIARRLLILAAEDIGLANPNALLMANTAYDAVIKIGWPESRIILSEAVIYLATSPKSNSAYMAINDAIAMVNKTSNLQVPLHLRNAPTKLMKNLGYGKEYKYSHSHHEGSEDWQQQFLPDEIKGTVFYEPNENVKEKELRNMLLKNWQGKYNY